MAGSTAAASAAASGPWAGAASGSKVSCNDERSCCDVVGVGGGGGAGTARPPPASASAPPAPSSRLDLPLAHLTSAVMVPAMATAPTTTVATRVPRDIPLSDLDFHLFNIYITSAFLKSQTIHRHSRGLCGRPGKAQCDVCGRRPDLVNHGFLNVHVIIYTNMG